MTDIKIGTLARTRKTYRSGGYTVLGKYVHPYTLWEGTVGWVSSSKHVRWVTGEFSQYESIEGGVGAGLIEIVEETNGADV